MDMSGPSFELGFTQNASAPNNCRAVTCYMAPALAATIQEISAVARRTRSYQQTMSPMPPSAAAKMGRNYKKCHSYKHLAPEHQQAIDNLAFRVDLHGYNNYDHSPQIAVSYFTNQVMNWLVWWSSERNIKIMYNNIFACIQKDSLSNNISVITHHHFPEFIRSVVCHITNPTTLQIIDAYGLGVEIG